MELLGKGVLYIIMLCAASSAVVSVIDEESEFGRNLISGYLKEVYVNKTTNADEVNVSKMITDLYCRENSLFSEKTKNIIKVDNYFSTKPSTNEISDIKLDNTKVLWVSFTDGLYFYNSTNNT